MWPISKRDARPASAPLPVDATIKPVGFWSFLLHLVGTPPTWSGFAKVVMFVAMLALCVVAVFGAAGWAIEQAHLAPPATSSTTGGVLGAVLLAAAGVTAFVKKWGGGKASKASGAPTLHLVGKDAA